MPKAKLDLNTNEQHTQKNQKHHPNIYQNPYQMMQMPGHRFRNNN